jgi:hypothetical protein
MMKNMKIMMVMMMTLMLMMMHEACIQPGTQLNGARASRPRLSLQCSAG